MDCQIRRADHVAELVLVGSLDSSWSSYFSDRIDEVVRGGALEVLVDMAGVSYLSSNGIGILIRYHRQMQKIGGRFRIVGDSDAVSHVLRLTGVLAAPPRGELRRRGQSGPGGEVRDNRAGRHGPAGLPERGGGAGATRAHGRPRAAPGPRV